MAKKPKPRCPKHDGELKPQKTKWGIRYCCPFLGCSVVCWDGGTSTPADYDTRQARRAAHAAFNPLWQDGRISKGEVYKQLSEFMGLPRKGTHIGYFDIQQCERVIKFVEDKDK